MKRKIVRLLLPNVKAAFELEIQEPGRVRNFAMSYAQRAVAIPVAGGEARAVDEIPTLLVEVDPEAPSRTRRFLLAQEDAVVEGPALEYLGCAGSRATNSVVALFERLEEPVT